MNKLMLMAAILLVCSCHKEKDKSSPEPQIRKEYRIAIVLPTEGKEGDYWKKSINWSLENLNNALIAQREIKVTAEWFNEKQSEQELKALFSKLADREDVCAIIGPLYSSHARIAAAECSRTSKMLISATASSESLMRQYAGKGFLWCLSENDISQCEVLLSRAKQKGAKSVSLLTSDDAYGQTFLDWFAFQAKELQLEVKSVEKYTANDVDRKMNDLLTKHTEKSHCLICVPNTQEIAGKMNTCRRNRTTGESFLLFSDVAYITPKDATFEGMEGITQTHDPQSGFAEAYRTRFSEEPGYGSAHYYDAITLAGMAILQADLTNGSDFNTYLKQIVDAEGSEVNTCSAAGISQAVGSLIAGKHPHCSGASGKLRFDKSVYTNVLHSVYCHWQVYEGKHQILEYNTSDDSRRTDASMANWNWKIEQEQQADAVHISAYLPRRKLNAIIIATSSGWNNYRHQANAYAMYQLLKKNGVDDEHILLISEDDIAYHPKNPKPGFIQSAFSDENLYNDVHVDYRLSEIKFEDLSDIVINTPNFTERFQRDNLFVYWAGDGEQTGPKWGDDIIPPTEMANFFRDLLSFQIYRQAFLVMETSYGGQVGIACEEQLPIPVFGLLCMTAGNEKETSKASRTDASGQVWISNSFTDNLLQQLTSQGDKISLYQLYQETYNKTIGSHVTLYNMEQFGILDRVNVKDFIYP